MPICECVSMLLLQDAATVENVTSVVVPCVSMLLLQDAAIIASPVDLDCISLVSINEAALIIGEGDELVCVALVSINEAASTGANLECISLVSINEKGEQAMGGVFEQTESEKAMPTDEPGEEDTIPTEWH